MIKRFRDDFEIDDSVQPVARDTSPMDDARLRQTSPVVGSSRGLKRSHNDVDIAQRTAADSPNAENRSQMSTGAADSGDEFMAEAERMTADWERNPWPMGAAAFLKDPERREEYVRTLAQLLRQSAGRPPKRQRAQIQNRRDDNEFLDDPESWNRSKKL